MHGSDFTKGFSKALGWEEIAQDQELGHPGSNPSPATDCVILIQSLTLVIIFLPGSWRSKSKWILRLISAYITLATEIQDARTT